VELKKQPETEIEYWKAIEGLGGYIWSTRHALANGRIDDEDGEVAKSIVDAQAILEGLVSELEVKFGVIHPKDCPRDTGKQDVPPSPEGKTYYWAWYKRMKAAFYQKEYDATICSACPMSEGLEQMIAMGGSVPCGVFSGQIYRLSKSFACAMLHSGGWSRERFERKIVEKGGEEALVAFKAKEQELMGSPA
jgi:hypothetical protein